MTSRDIGNLSDRELLTFARVFNDGHKGDEAAFGLTPAANTAFGVELSTFETELNDYDATQTAEATALLAKNNTRTAILQDLRQKISLQLQK